ncbi:MAG: DUF4138 domain-containing protein, partial [Chitinophagaceae bacterium]
PYDVDFIRLYLQDQQKTKRSSMQEQDITPLYQDEVLQVKANEINFVVAVPKFTVPDKKEFVLEIFEKNGGRNMALKVSNRLLFQVKPML